MCCLQKQQPMKKCSVLYFTNIFTVNRISRVLRDLKHLKEYFFSNVLVTVGVILSFDILLDNEPCSKISSLWHTHSENRRGCSLLPSCGLCGKLWKEPKQTFAQMVAFGTFRHSHDFLLFQPKLFCWLMIFLFAASSSQLHSTLVSSALKWGK